MALLPLYVVGNENRFVISETTTEGFSIPNIHQEDILDIKLTLLTRIRSSYIPFFERVSLQGYSLYVAVGTAGSALASQNSWVISSDGYSLSGTLDLNQSGINSLADGTRLIFEARLSTSTTKIRAATEVTYRKSVILAGVLSPPVSDVALGQLEAKRTYVSKIGAAGEGFILTSPDGNSQGFCYWHNDGSFRAEEVI